LRNAIPTSPKPGAVVTFPLFLRAVHSERNNFNLHCIWTW